MSFAYETKYGGLDALRVETLFDMSAKTGWGGQELYERLKNQGLGYRKTVMLEDYRHYQAVSKSLTPESRERAETWYEKVYKPLWEEQGHSTKKTQDFLNKVRAGSIETEEDAEAAGDYAEKYESAFA